MNLKFYQKRISGILTVLPQKEVLFEEEMQNYNFPLAKSMKLKAAMGYNKRRVANPGTCSSDLCVAGIEYLFSQNKIQPDEIDALILVTQTPDYIMPPTSNVIQGRLGLKQDMICLDINQGCAGYIIGLFQSFMLLEQTQINKVALLNADVLSPKVSQQDRNSHPLIGDAAAVTIIERTADPANIYCSMKMNGAGAYALQIPAGGARMPVDKQTAVLEEDSNGNFRSKEHLVMKGDEVFNFVQTEVPPLINELFEFSDKKAADFDYFMFHQPNKFMLQKLADKIGIPREKMPSNIVENFGNASGASIPTAITYNLGSKMLSQTLNLCLAGFGVGLTWAAMAIELGNLDFCETIEY